MANPEEPKRSALARTAHSFRFAASGLFYIVATQSNAKVHLVATLLIVALGVWLGLSNVEWALVATAVAAVWVAEGFNTAIEAVVDLVSPEPHPLAKTAKDVAAGAVLLAALFAVTIAVLIFVPAWERRETSVLDGSRLDPAAIPSSTRSAP